jgi:hypothetical protein
MEREKAAIDRDCDLSRISSRGAEQPREIVEVL